MRQGSFWLVEGQFLEKDEVQVVSSGLVEIESVCICVERPVAEAGGRMSI